jgi:hypothetical protein
MVPESEAESVIRDPKFSAYQRVSQGENGCRRNTIIDYTDSPTSSVVPWSICPGISRSEYHHRGRWKIGLCGASSRECEQIPHVPPVTVYP